MRYTPSYELKFVKESQFSLFAENMNSILDKYRHEGYMEAYDGLKIYYEYFLCENSKGSVVIVHGLSEFTKKYYEVTTYFLNMGYNVFLYDQRGHGKSDRMTKKDILIHVKSFRQYTKDLDLLIEKIVKPADDKPIYLYAHSMGGGVAADYLSQHTDVISKAILSAPLFQVDIGNVSVGFAKFGIKFMSILIGPKRWFKGSKEFNPEHKIENSNDESKSRFEHNLSLRCNNRCYQTTPMSLGWVDAMLSFELHIQKPRVVSKIKTPILLITAQNDTVVKSKPHYDFAKNCSTCEIIVQKNSKHAILTSTDDVISEHIHCVMDYFK
ncbi:MAG: alpha/beta hydrolase [Eubacteriales bacterium]|nr:alpha/beta hydrolase [Eubacteriales bacterium]